MIFVHVSESSAQKFLNFHILAKLLKPLENCMSRTGFDSGCLLSYLTPYSETCIIYLFEEVNYFFKSSIMADW